MVDENLAAKAAKANIRSYWIAVVGLAIVVYATFLQPKNTTPAQTASPTVSAQSQQNVQMVSNLGLFQRVMEHSQGIGIALIVIGLLVSGAMHLRASERGSVGATDGLKTAASAPYPTVRVIRHKEARKHNDAIYLQIRDQFVNAGWRVIDGSTDFPQHDNGIRVCGGTSFDRQMAQWGLNALGIKWTNEYGNTPPETLEVIVGRYDASSQAQIGGSDAKAIRVLERFYVALASLREHVGRMNKMKERGGDLSASAFIDIDIALRKMRKELVNLSPELFSTSEALDFRETVWSDPEAMGLAEDRVPKEIDHLMETVLRHWGRRGEAVGITPLRFKADPIVKLTEG